MPLRAAALITDTLSSKTRVRQHHEGMILNRALEVITRQITPKMMAGRKPITSDAIDAVSLGIMQLIVPVGIILGIMLGCAIIVGNRATCNARVLKSKMTKSTGAVEIISLQTQGEARIFTRGRETAGIK